MLFIIISMDKYGRSVGRSEPFEAKNLYSAKAVLVEWIENSNVWGARLEVIK